MESENVVFSINGNHGRELTVYENRCEICPVDPDGGDNVPDIRPQIFYYSELTGIKFKNLTFFTSGYIHFCLHRNVKPTYFTSDCCFFFFDFSSERRICLKEVMESAAAYIRERIKEENAQK